MINDAQIRQLIIKAVPAINPKNLDVQEFDWGSSAGYRYRRPEGGHYSGYTVAIQRTEQEMASELAADLSAKLIQQTIETVEISPYEGKRGKHPKNCTCSKHKALNGPQ